jgi:hypothetical protein
MLWVAAFAVIIVALLIPVLAVALDAPMLRRRREPEVVTLPERHDPAVELARRLLTLEDEVDDLSRTVGELRDELQFMQRLLDAGGPSDRDRGVSPSEP